MPQDPLPRILINNTLFETNDVFLDISTIVPMALRLLCQVVNFATTFLISVMLVFSIISFQREELETNIDQRKMKFAKLLVGIFGVKMLLLTIYKIFNISIALLMPGPLDYSDQICFQTISFPAAINYNVAVLTSLVAASYLNMRCSGKLEIMALMALASAAVATDYIALSHYNPSRSLHNLNDRLEAFKSCPDKNDMAYCYQIERMRNGTYRECLPPFKVCDGVIDIKKPAAIIPRDWCDTYDETIGFDGRPRYYHGYIHIPPKGLWIPIALDEVYCRSHFEPFVNTWMLCSLSAWYCAYSSFSQLHSFFGMMRSRMYASGRFAVIHVQMLNQLHH